MVDSLPWGVYNLGDELVSRKTGVTQQEAEEMAIRWNALVHASWYQAKPIPQTDTNEQVKEKGTTTAT